jgi:hypothetical protein
MRGLRETFSRSEAVIALLIFMAFLALLTL